MQEAQMLQPAFGFQLSSFNRCSWLVTIRGCYTAIPNILGYIIPMLRSRHVVAKWCQWSGYIQNFPWLLMPVLCNVIKTINKPSPKSPWNRCFFRHSQSWVVYDIVLTTLQDIPSGKHTKNFGTSPCHEWEHPLIHYFGMAISIVFCMFTRG